MQYDFNMLKSRIIQYGTISNESNPKVYHLEIKPEHTNIIAGIFTISSEFYEVFQQCKCELWYTENTDTIRARFDKCIHNTLTLMSYEKQVDICDNTDNNSLDTLYFFDTKEDIDKWYTNYLNTHSDEHGKLMKKRVDQINKQIQEVQKRIAEERKLLNKLTKIRDCTNENIESRSFLYMTYIDDNVTLISHLSGE